MLQLPDGVLDHVRASLPHECGGVIISTPEGLVYRPGELSKTGNHWVLNPYKWLDYERDRSLQYIVHSHVDAPPEPSATDRQAINAWGVPWIIISHPSEAWVIYEPSGGYRAPILHRKFANKTSDCYTLVRDVYARIGVTLPDFEREWGWWKTRGVDMITREYAQAGFSLVTDRSDLRAHDLIVMQLGVDAVDPNHFGIYCGDGKFLHHAHSVTIEKPPCRTVYGPYFRSTTRMILRHKDLM